MTSNLGADKLQKEASLGFQASSADDRKDLEALHEKNKDKVHAELKKMMRPELLNRIDKVIVFHALTQKNAMSILDLQLDELRQRLQKHGLGLQVSTSAKKHLLEKGYDALNGARPMRRLLQDTIEDSVATGLLDDTHLKGDIVSVGTKNDELTFTTKHE